VCNANGLSALVGQYNRCNYYLTLQSEPERVFAMIRSQYDFPCGSVPQEVLAYLQQRNSALTEIGWRRSEPDRGTQYFYTHSSCDIIALSPRLISRLTKELFEEVTAFDRAIARSGLG
jgi:hypothetical protein